MSIIDPPLAAGTARRLDQVGRGLLALLALSTVYAFVDGCRLVAAAGDDRLWIEFWRTTAYLVFAVLAVAPRTRWGVWELVFAQKLAVTVFGLANFGVNEARRDATTDLFLVIVMVISYVLCRGWYTWRSPAVVAEQR
jgi:hypothetical protein